MPEVKKIDIAKELLDSALYHYFETESYFACLHLAGAAEEVLGTYVKNIGGQSSFASLRDGAIRISKVLNGGKYQSSEKEVANIMNRAKNATKHMNKENDDRIFFEPKEAAKELLDRAATNYYHLMQYYPLEETEHMRQFNNELYKA